MSVFEWRDEWQVLADRGLELCLMHSPWERMLRETGEPALSTCFDVGRRLADEGKAIAMVSCYGENAQPAHEADSAFDAKWCRFCFVNRWTMRAYGYMGDSSEHEHRHDPMRHYGRD